MMPFNFATVRLGKASVNDIKLIDGLPSGILHENKIIQVVCTQVSSDFQMNTYVFIWLGSDNSKGLSTTWKQGFKAVGIVQDIVRGEKYNDNNMITIQLLFVFKEAINKLDILGHAPYAYYWCSALPIIGLDDHSNQTVRVLNAEAALSNIGAFFYCIKSVDASFEKSMLSLDARFKKYFEYTPNLPLVNESSTYVKELSYETTVSSEYPFNRIIFGAPGTGKSYLLNKDKDCLTNHGISGGFERVTFHPEYSYSQFVGTYKPTVDDSGNITYAFVPGPFMRVYVNALKSIMDNSPKPWLLIIEEINRANIAAVFGDIFQLLDRNSSGVSEYPIQASEDIRRFLAQSNQLGGKPSDYSSLRIPNNMFIWATMNSADQGVFPMDTAFKRRWDFEYIGIDEHQSQINGMVDLVQGNPETNISWNRLRKAINAKLLEVCRVNEDKLIGPFFLSKKCFRVDGTIDGDLFRKAFKSKIIMYLFEDAGRQYRSKLFDPDNCMLYSSICQSFDKVGMEIFGKDFKSDYYDNQKD